jgi:hypothetical protein
MSEAGSIADSEFFINGPHMIRNRMFTDEQLLRYLGVAEAFTDKKDDVCFTFSESDLPQELHYPQFWCC